MSRTRPLFAGPPSPEEFQRQLTDFVRQHFQNVRGPAFAQADSSGTAESQDKPKPEQFEFPYKPREVKAYLDSLPQSLG